MNSDKIRWYYNRLRSMPRREVLHRIRETVELRKPIRVSHGQCDLTLIEPTGTHGRLADVWRTFWSPAVAEHCRLEADKAISGAISVFGHSWSTHMKSWNLDPVSGYEWPADPAHKIDYRHESGADPKWTWEVNRLLFLVPVAFAIEAGELDRIKGESLISETVCDWIKRCQTGHGPQWSASIEVAIRSIVLTIAAQTVSMPTSKFSQNVSSAVLDHANWIRRFPSKYSSANNHRIAELAALLVLGSSWEGLLGDEERHALEVELADVSRTLFAADGIGLEQSPTYAGFSLEFLALVLHCHSWATVKSRAEIARIAVTASYAVAQLTNEDGSLIRYGDDDEGKVVTVAAPDGNYSESLVRLSSGHPVDRRQGLITFAAGGVTLMRFWDHDVETTWLLDHGPLGFGDIAAHGHADTLSVSMRSAGVNWIVDAGTYRYHGDKKWRTYFRSSRAHNGPQLNELDSSVMTGDFNWDPFKRAEGKLLVSQVEDSIVQVKASHDGYTRQGLGEVSRTVERLAPGHYRITDTGDSGYRLSSAFIINPTCVVKEVGDGWQITHPGTRMSIGVTVSGQSHANTERPADQSAWFSPSFGEKLPTWRLFAASQVSDSESRLVFDFKLSDSSHQEA